MAHILNNTRADGSASYTVRWRQHGKFHQRTFTARREAERFSLKVENELEEGSATEALTRLGKTFHEVAELSLAADRGVLKQRTIEGYESALNGHIYPTFGTRRISSITSQDVERWLAELSARPTPAGNPRSASSVRGTFLVAQKVFTYAEAHRFINRSPTVAVRTPRTGDYRPNYLTANEVYTLAKQLDSTPPYDLMVRMAAWTGLRSGELGALRIRDIDLQHNEVNVARTMSLVKDGWITTPPKSDRSRRTVPLLAEDVIHDLSDHLTAHPYRDAPDANLWPGKVHGHRILSYDRPFDPKGFYRYSFKPAAKAIGMPTLKFHELRHTFASLMAHYGVSMFELSRMMGHGSITVTDGTYAHLYKRDYSDLRARISTLAKTPR